MANDMADDGWRMSGLCQRILAPLARLAALTGLVLSQAILSQAFLAKSALAQAQDYPTRPVRFVVPYVAGGATDAAARLFAAQLQKQMNVAVIVENRAGAGGNVGAESVAKSPADGYTLLFNINGMAIAPALYAKLRYDPDKDFAAITQLVSTSTLLVVNPNVPARSLQELVALAKAKPGVLNYGSTGVGNSLHLTMEILKRATGADIQMVPFRGDAPLFQALFSGDIQVALVPTSATKAHVESGAVRALGISTAQRAPAMPNVPTIAEQGVPGFDMRGWMGLFAPAGTPRPIIEKLYRESKAALDAPDVKERLKALELDPVGSTPDEFARLVREDMARFAAIVKEANIPQQQ